MRSSEALRELRSCARAHRAVAFVAYFACSISALGAEPPAPPTVRSASGIRTLNGFVANRGQWPADVLFFARAGGIEATLTRDALVFRPAPPKPESGRPWPAPVVLGLLGSGEAIGEGRLPTLHHFFLATGSASDVPGYERVVYRGVQPGIDVAIRIAVDPQSKAERFAYDLLVAPGAVLEDFALEVEGAVVLGGSGTSILAMETEAGVLEQRIGRAWQIDPEDGREVRIEAEFGVVAAGNGEARARVEFAAPQRDASRAFVLDPTLVWATYVGGAQQEEFTGVDVDAAGATYLTCKTFNGTPTTPGAFQPVAGGNYDAWVGKVAVDGSVLEWASYLGGIEPETPVGVAVDGDGSIVIFGVTFSAAYPTTPGSLQRVYSGTPGLKGELFVTRLAPSGSTVLWSTLYGGPQSEEPRALALFPSGDVLIAAEPRIASPPATPGAFDTVFDYLDIPGDYHDQFLARISADGTTLVFQTYFQAGRVLDLAIDTAENIYFCGDIEGIQGPLPATPGAFKTTTSGATMEGYVAKMNGLGMQLLWATYLGGEEGYDTVWGIAIDAASAVYVAGQTTSDNFPVTASAFSQALSGQTDGFVAKLLPHGTSLVWSTYFGSTCCGGVGYESDVAVDAAGYVYSFGVANEPSFPTTPDAFQPNYNGPFPVGDAHFTKFDAFCGSLVYSTWFGGSSSDDFGRLTLDASQDPHIAIMSSSANIPVTPGAYDNTYAGGSDILVAKFDLPLMPWIVMNGGKSGSIDIPNLAGSGVLTPGSPCRVSIRGAAPVAPGLMFAGVTAIHAPALGGTLVPAPDIVVPIGISGAGELDLLFPWPAIPNGVSLYIQAWISDAGALAGWSATNALRLTAQ